MSKHISNKDFSSYLFWDVDGSKIDFEQSKAYVIERVLSHGLLSDWNALKNLYGKDEIRKIVINLRYLDKRSHHFCASYFNVPLEKFRCYTYAQLNPGHWNY